MDPTSASLLDQLRGPDRAAAWARFVQLYTPLLFRWADRLGVPPADQADLVQDVFLALLRALPSFPYDRGRSFRARLNTVFVNKWKDARRKKSPALLAADGSGFPAPAVEDPTRAVEEAEYRAVLVARAARLVQADFTPATWQAFWATAAEGKGAAEVAAALGLSTNAVYLARSRVLARLRQELEGLLE
jgi:RNA polymerase sigma-70 factor (ECF subfamily)